MWGALSVAGDRSDAGELVYGKLGGIFYNAKEMVLLPMLLAAALWLAGSLSLENLLFVLGGLAVLYVFAATLGLHAGMTYVNSGAAVATSLATVFFLSLGVALCMQIMLAFSGSFSAVSPLLRLHGVRWRRALRRARRPQPVARPSAWRRSCARSPPSTPSPAT